MLILRVISCSLTWTSKKLSVWLLWLDMSLLEHEMINPVALRGLWSLPLTCKKFCTCMHETWHTRRISKNKTKLFLENFLLDSEQMSLKKKDFLFKSYQVRLLCLILLNVIKNKNTKSLCFNINCKKKSNLKITKEESSPFKWNLYRPTRSKIVGKLCFEIPKSEIFSTIN